MLFSISKSTSLLKQGFHGDEVEESNDFDLKKKKKKFKGKVNYIHLTF